MNEYEFICLLLFAVGFAFLAGFVLVHVVAAAVARVIRKVLGK